MHDHGTRRGSSVGDRALGVAVSETRARRGLSQEEVGFRSGLHRNYVGAVERGEVNPTLRTLTALAAGRDVPLLELFALYDLRRAEAR